MRSGIRLGVDVGTVRVGVASSDPSGLLATPVQTLARAQATNNDVLAVAELADDAMVIEVVVGLPLNMRGQDTASTQAAREWANTLKRLRPRLRVVLVDERLTSVTAHRSLHDSGVAGRKHRRHVDQQAAVLILQSALDTERGTGEPAGAEVGARKPRVRRSPTTEGGSHDV